MLTKDFLNLLGSNQGKELIFEYAENQFVPAAYHITEVKNVHFESVDCGGFAHEEFQTIVQLWVSEREKKDKGMETQKAFKIMNLVDNVKPLRKDTEIFFEYGRGDLRTSNYSVEKVEVQEDKVILKMYVQPTACKPRNIENIKDLKQVVQTCC
jgi:Family of unknown function (DUF6428)